MKHLVLKSLLGLVLILLASACSLKPASEMSQLALEEQRIQELATEELSVAAQVTL